MSSNRITRRSLAKRLLMTSAAASTPGVLFAQEKEQSLRQAADWTEVHPGVWKARIGTPEFYTPVSGRLVDPQVNGFDRLPRVAESPLPSISGATSIRGTVVRLPLRPNELVFGLGLQLLSFDQRGKKKTIRVNADPRFDSGDSHAPVPFYVTTKGVGILVDTARYASFFVGNARPKPEEPATMHTSLAQATP